MRNLFYLFVLTTILTACSSNDSSSIDLTNSDLVGAWNVTAYESKITQTVTSQGTTVSSDSEGVGKDFNFTLSFNENPNETSAQGSFTLVTTTKVPGQPDVVQEVPFNSASGFDSGQWSLSNNVITITDSNNQITTLNVIQFNGDELILRATTEQTQNILGTVIEISGETILTLEK